MKTNITNYFVALIKIFTNGSTLTCVVNAKHINSFALNFTVVYNAMTIIHAPISGFFPEISLASYYNHHMVLFTIVMIIPVCMCVLL